MKGFPKHLNSKNDYLNVKESFPEKSWKPVFQELLDNKDGWLMESKLTSIEETGKTDSKNKVVEIMNEKEEVTEKYQYEFKEDPNCKLFKLGFNVNEITEYLK